jgi:ABC-type uncharacterized transport system fused permease/ATPase subunit
VNNIRLRPATVWRIAAPYFRSEDKFAGRLLLAAVIAIELTVVGLNVLFNEWNNRFYTALQEKNWDSFVREIGIFCVLATAYIALAVYQLYLNQWLQIRWRNWLTHHYLGEWLDKANHYRMQLQGDAADNPDQRIADDVKMFVEQTLTICVGFLSAVVTLGSFVIILWGLSADSPLTLFGNEFHIPGYLVWGAVVYAVFGTVITHWIGSPLVMLDFQQQRYEADFRFNLVRVRENSEQIALLRGENAEQERLLARFGRVVQNWYEIMTRTKRLTAFTSSYSQAAVVFPYVLVAPAYFTDKIQLGGMMQTASAFSSVQQALSFFVSRAGRVEFGCCPSRGFRGNDRKRRPASGRYSLDQGRALGRKQSDRAASVSGQLAQRHAAGCGRWPAYSKQRARSGHRTVGSRQVHPVPRNCRHLAVRRRRDHHPRQRHADDVAAAAVFSDRRTEGGDRLPCEPRRIQFGSR